MYENSAATTGYQAGYQKPFQSEGTTDQELMIGRTGDIQIQLEKQNKSTETLLKNVEMLSGRLAAILSKEMPSMERLEVADKASDLIQRTSPIGDEIGLQTSKINCANSKLKALLSRIEL